MIRLRGFFKKRSGHMTPDELAREIAETARLAAEATLRRSRQAHAEKFALTDKDVDSIERTFGASGPQADDVHDVPDDSTEPPTTAPEPKE